jgi:hypothetical protein
VEDFEAPERAEAPCVAEASALMETDHATCEPGRSRRWRPLPGHWYRAEGR